jgi:uncharacterized membrane protein
MTRHTDPATSHHPDIVCQTLEERRPISRDTNEAFDGSSTFGQRMADRIAAVGGSWAFLISFGVVLAVWVTANSLVLTGAWRFDPYPFVFLNLMLSMLAAVQAPVIMMSQNRQSAKDRLDARHDFEVNLKAELEILSLHSKLDALRADHARQFEQLHQLLTSSRAQ